MNRIKRTLRSLLVTSAALILLAGPAQAESAASEGGWGALAGLGTLLYSPAKVVYATCGILFGGVAWGLSGGDSQVLEAVITPAVRGDYVLLPQHIRGKQRLEFFGRDPRYDSFDPVDVAADRPSSISEETF